MTTVKAEIEVVLRVPGTLVYDHESYLEWLDGNEPDNDSLFEYIRRDPDWLEGSEFAVANSDDHEVIDVEMVSVNDNEPPLVDPYPWLTEETGDRWQDKPEDGDEGFPAVYRPRIYPDAYPKGER